jgi:hypothetical protein
MFGGFGLRRVTKPVYLRHPVSNNTDNSGVKRWLAPVPRRVCFPCAVVRDQARVREKCNNAGTNVKSKIIGCLVRTS